MLILSERLNSNINNVIRFDKAYREGTNSMLAV